MPDLTTLTRPEPTTMIDVVSPYVGVFFVAWFVTMFLTPLMGRLAARYDIVDWPDDERKRHVVPVAYLGGLAIFFGWLAGILLYLVIPHLPSQLKVESYEFPISIIAGAVIVTVTGLIDDVFGINPRVKIGGQLLAAAMIASITDLGSRLVHQTFNAVGIITVPWFDYWLGMVVIALFIIGFCNAVNLLDGLDGLAAGVVSIACLGFLVIACFIAIQLTDPATSADGFDLLSNPVRLVMCLAILGALLGFLPHNFNPASIFMGDAGSLLLGYLCATTMLSFAHSPKAGPVMVSAALIVFALPISDTALAISRRIMARQPVFGGDDRHLHHQLVAGFSKLGCGSNLSMKLAVISMYGLAVIYAALGCALLYTRWRFALAVLAVYFGFVMVAGFKAGRRKALALKSAKRRPVDADHPAATPLHQVDPGHEADPAPSPKTQTSSS